MREALSAPPERQSGDQHSCPPEDYRDQYQLRAKGWEGLPHERQVSHRFRWAWAGTEMWRL